MSDLEAEVARLRRRSERDRLARIEAEHLLESKSRELYEALEGASVARNEAQILTILRTTELTEANRQLAAVAYTDALTGLPNRAAFEAELDTVFDNPALRGKVSFVMVDLNELKAINDTMGHSGGDSTLKVLARIMEQVCATLPGSTAARLAGDEFGLLAVGSEPAEVLKAATLICDLAYERIPSGASVGLACSERLGELIASPSELLRYADAAQYQGKRTRSRRPVVASPDALDAPMPTALQRRAFRGLTAESEQLFADIAERLDSLTERDVLSRLACAAEVLLAPANVSAWAISTVAPGSGLFHTLLTESSGLSDEHRDSLQHFFGVTGDYFIADYPVAARAALGRVEVVRAADPSCPPEERDYLASGGFEVMVMSGGRDAAGSLWLMEAFSTSPDFPAEIYALPFRAAVAMAITSSTPLPIPAKR